MNRALFVTMLLGALSFSLSAVTAYAQFNDKHVASGILNVSVFQRVCGDQNGDEIIDADDVEIDMGILVELTEPTNAQEILSDLNASGDIDLLDAITGLKHLANSTSPSDCGG